MNRKTAMIAMSGGVDSSVAAWLTQQAGYLCQGAIMRLYDHQDATGCHDTQAIDDARQVAEKLNFPFHVLSCQNDFREYVIDHFIGCYETGLTPNPCIQCNRHLKFHRFLKEALDRDCEYIVTGHYARIQQDTPTGRYLLCKALDESKDQTYFLYNLTQHQLAHTLLPLGELTKAEARNIAEEQGFLNARKRDSQDICFIPDGDYAAFIALSTGKNYPQGNYLDLNGNIIGTHQGAIRYTIGQRKGLGIALGAPAYVCKKDMVQNTVTLGPNEALMSPALRANDWNWIAIESLTEPMRVTAKIRHSQFAQPATVYPEEHGFARVAFDIPQRAISPGQAVVLYLDDIVLGGGTITEALKEE